MKTKTLLALGLCAAVGWLTATGRSAHACDACDAKKEIKLPDTAEGILKSLHDHDAALRDLVAAKKLNRVSFLAINMRILAKALPAKAAGEKKAGVEESVKDFSAILKDFGKAALHEDQRATVSHLAKLEEKLKTIDGQFNPRPPAGRATIPGASGGTNHFQHLGHDAPARSAAPGVVLGVE